MAHLDRLVPRPRRTEDHEGAKALLFVRAWAVTVPFALSVVVINLVDGLPGQVALNLAIALVGPLMIWRLWRGGDLDRLLRVSLGLTSVFYALGALTQSPFDASSIFFLVVTPVLAGFVFGGRQALGWMAFTLALGLATMAAGLHGVTLPQTDPAPALTMVLNFTFLMVLVALASVGIHDLKDRAFHRLDAASRAKSAFLANMSHEIRTPMNGVLGLTEVMLGEPLPPHQRERLELIKRSGEVLATLVNQVLDLARIEAGRLEVAPVATALGPLMTDVRDLFASAAQQQGLRLELDLHPALPDAVAVDPTRLRQVLFNLVSNAVKFTDAGRVRLAVSPLADGRLRFAVEDTGQGIAADALPRLFAAFEQADGSTTRRHGGSGLGLAISRQVVEAMGGTLAVESTPGVGSTFSFAVRLPAVEAPAPAAPTAAPRLGGRVLVVDDNPINLRVAAGLVQRAGYSVVAASSGREALAVFQGGQFDLVLMDCHMPDLDGFEAARTLRRSPGRGAEVPIFALSASSFPEDLAACEAAGMDGFLAKPVSLEKLEETLAHGLRLEPGRHAAR